jgi:hypothetical protein
MDIKAAGMYVTFHINCLKNTTETCAAYWCQKFATTFVVFSAVTYNRKRFIAMNARKKKFALEDFPFFGERKKLYFLKFSKNKRINKF